jgi:hypothetical protein
VFKKRELKHGRPIQVEAVREAIAAFPVEFREVVVAPRSCWYTSTLAVQPELEQ